MELTDNEYEKAGVCYKGYEDIPNSEEDSKSCDTEVILNAFKGDSTINESDKPKQVVQRKEYCAKEGYFGDSTGSPYCECSLCHPRIKTIKE